MAVSDQLLQRKLDTIIALMRMSLGEVVKPTSLPDPEELEVKSGGEVPPSARRIKREKQMAHFIRNRQHMSPVPSGKDITRQTLTVTEDDVEILPETDVAFDPGTGVETPPLPEFWAEVGKTVERTVKYYRADGSESQPFSLDYVQEDQFTPPLPNPSDIGATEQIDEIEADTRPTI